MFQAHRKLSERKQGSDYVEGIQNYARNNVIVIVYYVVEL